MVTAARTEETLAVVERFNEVFNTGNVERIMALFTDDCVFDNTSPTPDGQRYVGQAAVCQFWSRFFSGSNEPRFETEEIFAAEDRCFTRWRYSWKNPDGSTGHIRGADVFRVRDGKVAEKFSYVKG